jgi:hypothetical protein
MTSANMAPQAAAVKTTLAVRNQLTGVKSISVTSIPYRSLTSTTLPSVSSGATTKLNAFSQARTDAPPTVVHQSSPIDYTTTVDADPALFGTPRNCSKVPADTSVHPRVLFNRLEWENLITNYRQSPGVWETFFLSATGSLSHGDRAQAQSNNVLSAIDALETFDCAQNPGECAEFLEVLRTKTDAKGVSVELQMNDLGAASLFLQVLHTAVEGNKPSTIAKVITRLRTWATIVNAHADKYACNEVNTVAASCTAKTRNRLNSALWDRNTT